MSGVVATHAARVAAAVVFVCFASAASQALHAQAEPPYTLAESYRLSLQRSETIARQVALIDQAEARIEQARARFRPTLSLGATVLRQEQPTTPLGDTLFPAQQTTVNAVATQDIFRGFRDLAALRGRTLERRAAELAREQAEVQLFQDMAQAFYNVLTYRRDLENYRNELAANEERLRELQDLRRLARARATDIASVESALASLEAAAANTQGLLDAAQETFSFLTGLPPDVALADAQPYPAELAPLAHWLRDVEHKPGVRRARAQMLAAEQNIEAAKGGRLPEVGLSARYYADRPGISSEVDWDVQLNVTQPLYTGGLVQAQIQEAVAQRREAELALEQTRQEATRDIRALYRTLQANLAQTERLTRAVELAERNHRLLLQDYRSGLASNLDVLQVRANLYQTQRALARARFAAKYNYATLQAITAPAITATGAPDRSVPDALPVRE